MKLNEVFLFARPEEKRAIEGALISMVGPLYTVMPALGRGSKGATAYGSAAESAITRFFSRPALSSFLPKTLFYLVVEEEIVDPLLKAISGALAAEGGPDDCGRGLAIVCPIDAQHGININPPKQDDASEDIEVTDDAILSGEIETK